MKLKDVQIGEYFILEKSKRYNMPNPCPFVYLNDDTLYDRPTRCWDGSFVSLDKESEIIIITKEQTIDYVKKIRDNVGYDFVYDKD
jgi:hypothetical protein